MNFRPLTVAAVVVLTLTGCGKELGRIPFTAEGSGETTATLAAGDVDLWTAIDLEYKGDATLTYKVELLQDGAPVGSVVCSPLGNLNVKTSWVETNFNDAHSRSGNGKMACSVKLAKAGPTTIKASLAFGTKPASLKLSRADLVVKQ